MLLQETPLGEISPLHSLSGLDYFDLRSSITSEPNKQTMKTPSKMALRGWRVSNQISASISMTTITQNAGERRHDGQDGVSMCFGEWPGSTTLDSNSLLGAGFRSVGEKSPFHSLTLNVAF